jgi:hypothetical protein
VLATGLIGGANSGVDTTFDNFGVQAVPEPRGLAWVVAGAVALVAATKRRLRTAGDRISPRGNPTRG